MSNLQNRHRRCRLLIVEEDRHNIDQLRDVFTEKGYECEVALDLETARRILRERFMDISAVNLATAGLKDEELIGEFKASDPGMVLVLYNGTTKKTRQRRLRRMGADSYLSRNSDIGAVIRSIERVMEAHEQAR